MDPRIEFPPEILPGVGPQFRYDPVSNPFGARGDVYDHTVNVYGYIRNTPVPGQARFAQRPLDNVGVQYGLRAMNDGAISVDDFLDLNENIGGVDIDFNHIPTRTTAYLPATRRAYEGGRILYGGNGLASTAIITRMGGNDLLVQGDVHLRYHSFAIRQRLLNANGRADNQVIVGNLAPGDLLINQMGQWLAAVVADQSNRSRAEKVVRNKPVDVVDACWTTTGEKIVETQTLNGPGRCNQPVPGRRAARVRGRRADRPRHHQVPSEADRQQRLQGAVHGGAARSPADHLPRGRVRLVPAWRAPGRGGSLGVLRAVAGQPAVRRDEPQRQLASPRQSLVRRQRLFQIVESSKQETRPRGGPPLGLSSSPAAFRRSSLWTNAVVASLQADM
jgi:hypothetical protein